MKNIIVQSIKGVLSGIGIFIFISIWRFIQRHIKLWWKNRSSITTKYEIEREKTYPCKDYEEATLGFGTERIERESIALMERNIPYSKGLWRHKIYPFLNRIKNRGKERK